MHFHSGVSGGKLVEIEQLGIENPTKSVPLYKQAPLRAPLWQLLLGNLPPVHLQVQMGSRLQGPCDTYPQYPEHWHPPSPAFTFLHFRPTRSLTLDPFPVHFIRIPISPHFLIRSSQVSTGIPYSGLHSITESPGQFTPSKLQQRRYEYMMPS